MRAALRGGAKVRYTFRPYSVILYESQLLISAVLAHVKRFRPRV
jgi:hypothetical protein